MGKKYCIPPCLVRGPDVGKQYYLYSVYMIMEASNQLLYHKYCTVVHRAVTVKIV